MPFWVILREVALETSSESISKDFLHQTKGRNMSKWIISTTQADLKTIGICLERQPYCQSKALLS